MRTRVAKIDTDRESKVGRGLVNEGASFGVPLTSPACPFKANGRRRAY